MKSHIKIRINLLRRGGGAIDGWLRIGGGAIEGGLRVEYCKDGGILEKEW